MGVLQRRVPVNISVTTPAANAGDTGITLQKVLRIPQLQNFEIIEVDSLTIAPNEAGQLTATFGNNVIRILLEVNPPTAGAAVVLVTQGLNVFEDPQAGDATYVFDVVA